MKKKFVFNFGKVYIYDNYAIGTMNEGESFEYDKIFTLFQYSIDIFGSKPFGYISNRVNSYSIDPQIYSITKLAKNLVAVAIVINNPVQKMSASVEEMFINLPFKYFNSLDEAKEWMKIQLSNHSASVQSA